MNYRANHARHYAESQRVRQGYTGSAQPPRHPAFVRQRGGTETVVNETDRERARLWHRTEWESMQRARKEFVAEMLDKYGGHRASKLLGYAVQTLYAIRASVRGGEGP